MTQRAEAGWADELIADLRTLERISGLPVGMLTDEEMRVFKKAVSEGRAQRDYSGVLALFGCAKVRLVRQTVS